MSYSIFVVFNNTDERNEMLAFLESEFKPLSELVPPVFAGIHETDSTLPHDDLAYLGDFTEPRLGYNYGAGTTELERDYRFALCVWMAVHAGKQMNNHPSVIYDGQSDLVICATDRTDCPCAGDIRTDNYGYKALTTLTLLEHALSLNPPEESCDPSIVANVEPFTHHLQETNQNVHNEIKRLTNLWLTQQQKEPEMAKKSNELNPPIQTH